MRTFDLTPLYRYSVGFDRMNRLFDAVARWDEAAAAYPPYNIEKTGERGYRIAMAVAGFREAELGVAVTENSLVVTGRKEEPAEKGGEFLHRGIPVAPFERKFELAENIRVTGARLADGILSIDLEQLVPEEKKPRTIAIQSAGAAKAA